MMPMAPLISIGQRCYTFDFGLVSERVVGESYLGCSWLSGKMPAPKAGEILLGEEDFRQLVFRTNETTVTFVGLTTHISPGLPTHVLLRAADVVPVMPENCRERIWVNRRFLPSIVKRELGSIRSNDLFGERALWLQANRPFSRSDVEAIGYKIVFGDARPPIERAVPVHDFPVRGVVFPAQHCGELERFGVEGLSAVALSSTGLRLSRFAVRRPSAAAVVLPWLGHLPRGTVIDCDWPFNHSWRVAVSVNDLGSLQGDLGEPIFDDGYLWMRHENLRLRDGCNPVPLKSHPTIKMPFFLTSPASRQQHLVSQSAARKTHVTRGLVRYQLVEEGRLLAQAHYRRGDLTDGRSKANRLARKERLQLEYAGFSLPSNWERYSDDTLRRHLLVEQSVRSGRWKWERIEADVDGATMVRFYRWMSAKGLSLTSPVSYRTCYRYGSPREALQEHDPVELIQELYPKSATFIFECACRPGFAAKAMLATLAS